MNTSIIDKYGLKETFHTSDGNTPTYEYKDGVFLSDGYVDGTQLGDAVTVFSGGKDYFTTSEEMLSNWPVTEFDMIIAGRKERLQLRESL